MTPKERKSVNEMLAINTELVEQNAKLLEAAKGVLDIVRNSYNSDCRGPGDRCSMLEQAIAEAEGRHD